VDLTDASSEAGSEPFRFAGGCWLRATACAQQIATRNRHRPGFTLLSHAHEVFNIFTQVTSKFYPDVLSCIPILKKQDTVCKGLKWNHLALVNTVMNLRVPNVAGNFLASWATISFSRRSPLHGVVLMYPQTVLNFCCSHFQTNILLNCYLTRNDAV
jgi:hypothetical protein